MPSLRDFGGRLTRMLRRLKPTVNNMSSLRDLLRRCKVIFFHTDTKHKKNFIIFAPKCASVYNPLVIYVDFFKKDDALFVL